MELGDPKEISDYVTIKYLAKIIHSSVRTINKWIESNGLKATYKVLAHRQKISRIKLTDFWEWAEKHQNLINWNKFECKSLGAEPTWAKQARRNCKKKRTTWTKERENLVESYFKLGLSWKQVGENMDITAGAARTRHNLIVRRKKKENYISIS
jgi:hypothetical protein